MILEIQDHLTKRNYSVIKTAEKSIWKKGKKATVIINSSEYEFSHYYSLGNVITHASPPKF